VIEAQASPTRTRLRRLALALGRAALAVVVVQHGLLLVERLRDDSIAEPLVALRWGLAAIALGLAAIYRRRGLTVFSGRSGLAFWLLGLLLHVGATPVPAVGIPSENLLVALPIGIVTTLAVAFGASRIAAILIARSQPGSAPKPVLRPPRALPAAPVLSLRFAPRPPPAA